MTAAERYDILHEVFKALCRCPVYPLRDSPELGMRRMDASAALASLNAGIVPKDAREDDDDRR